MKNHNKKTAQVVNFSAFSFKGKASELARVEARLMKDAVLIANSPRTDEDDEELFETLFDLYRAKAVRKLANQSVVQSFRVVRKNRKKTIYL